MSYPVSRRWVAPLSRRVWQATFLEMPLLRTAVWRAGNVAVVASVTFAAEESLVEEEESGEGFELGAGSDVSVDGELGEGGIDFAVGELAGVDPVGVEVAGKTEVAVDPGDVGFFGPFGDVEHPHYVAELLEQLGLFGWGGGGIFLHGWRPPVEFRSV